MVAYVFGALGAQTVPGPVLVALLGDLGLSEPTARTMISRMVRGGQLSVTRRGRVAIYRMQGALWEQFLRVREADTTPVWDGSFAMIIYDVPETRRAERDALREQAGAAGFGQIRPGVLIGFADPAGWCRPWLDRDDILVTAGRFDCDPDTAVELVERVWAPATRAGDHWDLLNRLQRLLRDHGDRPPAGRSAFVIFNEVMHDYAALHLTMPALPAELTPEDWPGRTIPTVVGRLSRLFGPPIVEHASDVAHQHGLAHLVEPLG